MKKMTVLAVILILLLSLAACSKDEAVETTEATTVAATVPAEVTVAQDLSVTEWNMSASTWSSPNGATIHITAIPNIYTEGQRANFVVRLENDDIVSIPCQWNGTEYTASADLNAANGYCYYVILIAADGTPYETAVNTPSQPYNDSFINMEAALESYCSVTVTESDFSASQLSLTSGSVQVLVPTITNEGNAITCQEASLVLSYMGNEISKQTLTLTETDTTGLYEADLSGMTFTIPEMEDDQKIDLVLNVSLTNGHALTAYGGNWVYNAEALLPVVG
jgi:hypothetical protein